MLTVAFHTATRLVAVADRRHFGGSPFPIAPTEQTIIRLAHHYHQTYPIDMIRLVLTLYLRKGTAKRRLPATLRRHTCGIRFARSMISQHYSAHTSTAYHTLSSRHAASYPGEDCRSRPWVALGTRRVVFSSRVEGSTGSGTSLKDISA